MAFASHLEQLGRALQKDGYGFTTPSPATHARVLARRVGTPNLLVEMFGWNRTFDAGAVPAAYRPFLTDPQLFAGDAGRLQARVRFSTLGPLLLAHSGFPTKDMDAVFFGPDTYRFANALQALRDREPNFAPSTCVDVGTGSGAGGLFCAKLFSSLQQIQLLDINDHALAFASANARLNDIRADIRHSDGLKAFESQADLIVSNPPYLVDRSARAYRHGGGPWGAALAVRILAEALDRLAPAGHLLLYTGSAIVHGQDKFLEAAAPLLQERTVRYRYDEGDPDVFGEELEIPPYDQADRIATVVLHVRGSDLKR